MLVRNLAARSDTGSEPGTAQVEQIELSQDNIR